MKSKIEILKEIELYEDEKNNLNENPKYTEFQKKSLLVQYDLIIGTLNWVLQSE